MVIIFSLIFFVVGAALIGLLQLWFAPFEPQVFFKIELSIAILFAIVFAIWFFIKEHKENEANKSNKLID